ncbi:MAG: integrase arm-type DNA-binding domain-containing protein [Steroidobacter sp.]
MPLTVTQIQNVKPQHKAVRLFDERGLYLEIVPSGGRWWRFKYRFAGKEKRISLGVYPDVGLKDAREKRDEARKQVAAGIDPGEVRKAAKHAIIEKTENTLAALAREWFAKYSPNWAPTHSSKIIRRLEADIFPWLGAFPIRDVKAPELLTVLRRIEARGAVETAHRVLQNCGQIFRYAVATGRADRDVSADLRGALPPVKERHHPSITEPKLVGALLRAIEGYRGSYVTKCALKLAPLVFVRPGELRKAEWSEVNFEQAEWRIPATRMKMRALHIVPLSAQAMVVLRELQSLTGSSRFIFPSARGKCLPMSENTVNAALRRLGYDKTEMTGHGFRSMASTLLNEQGWNRDAIERQLSHAERDSIRAAYNYAEHLPERKRMMQAWADYLDTLTAGATVIPLRSVNGP